MEASPLLFANEEITDELQFAPETVFRLCIFEGAREGATLEGALLWCTVQHFDWYAPFFNTTVVANTVFRNMALRGASFRGCRFVECEFERCRFVLDNMGGECTVDDCIFAECSFTGCTVEHAAKSGRSVFSRNRWYGCTQKGCRGMEGLF